MKLPGTRWPFRIYLCPLAPVRVIGRLFPQISIVFCTLHFRRDFIPKIRSPLYRLWIMKNEHLYTPYNHRYIIYDYFFIHFDRILFYHEFFGCVLISIIVCFLSGKVFGCYTQYVYVLYTSIYTNTKLKDYCNFWGGSVVL